MKGLKEEQRNLYIGCWGESCVMPGIKSLHCKPSVKLIQLYDYCCNDVRDL